MGTIWKDIPGYEGRYQASNTGLIRSLDSSTSNLLTGGVSIRSGKILKPWLQKGYLRVGLSIGKSHQYRFVHRLVALTFIPMVKGKYNINHIDGDKCNNAVSNLEWCNPMENVTHSRLVLKRIGYNKKMVVDSISGEVYDSIKEAHQKKGYSHSLQYTVSMVNGRYKNKTTLKFAQ